MQVSMTVNGSNVSHDVEPRTLLVHYLREQAGLTGPTSAAIHRRAELAPST